MNKMKMILYCGSILFGSIYGKAYKAYKDTCESIAVELTHKLPGKKLKINGDKLTFSDQFGVLLTNNGDTIKIAATDKSIYDLFITFPENTVRLLSQSDPKVEDTNNMLNSMLEFKVGNEPYDMRMNGEEDGVDLILVKEEVEI